MSLPQPYRNAELYRGHAPVARLAHVDCIAIAADGTTLIGRSDLNGRIWNGIVRVVSSPEELIPDINKKQSYPNIVLSNGVSDACFIGDSSKLLVADDVGELSIFNKQTTWSGVAKTGEQEEAWTLNCSMCEHDDGVQALDLSSQGDRIVSGGSDNCIKVWDLSLTSLETLRPAHTHIVTDLDCNKISDSFLSSSLDGTVALWDIKCPKANVKVLVNMDCAARTVCWISSSKFVAGFDNGEIVLYDISQPGNILSKTDIRHPVHRILYNERLKCLAVCSDSNKLNVFTITDNFDFVLAYDDSRHSEYIRGMSWGNGVSSDLYTCGWDSKVYKHSVQIPI